METQPGLEQTTKKKKKKKMGFCLHGSPERASQRALRRKIPPRHVGSLIWGRRRKGEKASPRCPPARTRPLQTPPSRAGLLLWACAPRGGLSPGLRGSGAVNRHQAGIKGTVCRQLLGVQADPAEARLSSPALVTWPALPYPDGCTQDLGPHHRGKTKARVGVTLAPLLQNEGSRHELRGDPLRHLPGAGPEPGQEEISRMTSWPGNGQFL